MVWFFQLLEIFKKNACQKTSWNVCFFCSKRVHISSAVYAIVYRETESNLPATEEKKNFQFDGFVLKSVRNSQFHLGCVNKMKEYANEKCIVRSLFNFCEVSVNYKLSLSFMPSNGSDTLNY